MTCLGNTTDEVLGAERPGAHKVADHKAKRPRDRVKIAGVILKKDRE